MSLSDQQLVTGLAILVAGYYEMFNNNLDLYHWQIVVYLAWLSSSVHIASLTLLRDVLNRNATLRNLRVAGMLILLVLLSVAMWPTRFMTWMSNDVSQPARCYWTSPAHLDWYMRQSDPNWIISMLMLLLAYAWKLSQLFSSSRGFIRRWLVAKPEAALERLLRRTALSYWPRWTSRLQWLAVKVLTIYYICFVVYAEFAESFVASIIYLCMTLPYGITLIVARRSSMDDQVLAGEAQLTFGQLVPLFLLTIPILLVVELLLGMLFSLRANLTFAPSDRQNRLG